MMKKILKLVTAVTAALALTAGAAYAGEFNWQPDGRLYYNTGEPSSYNGWAWIQRSSDGLARCYYLYDNGYVMTNRWTPDGYQVGPDGAWMVNGQEVTRPYINGMGRETNWYSFGGNYHVRSLQYTSGAVDYYNGNEWPLYIESATTGFTLVWNDGTRQWFVPENGMYSYVCSDGTLIDVVDENNFRIIWDGDVIYTVTR